MDLCFVSLDDLLCLCVLWLMTVSFLFCRLPFEQDVEQGNVAHLGDCDGKKRMFRLCLFVRVCVCLSTSVRANGFLVLTQIFTWLVCLQSKQQLSKKEDKPGSFILCLGNPQINTETSPSPPQCSVVFLFSQKSSSKIQHNGLLVPFSLWAGKKITVCVLVSFLLSVYSVLTCL